MDRILESVYRNTVCMYYTDVSGSWVYFGRYVYDLLNDSDSASDPESIEYRFDLVWSYPYIIDGDWNDHTAGGDQSICDP